MNYTPGTSKYEHQLSLAFDFTQDDLEANQRGQITPRQIKILIAKRDQTRVATGFFKVIFAFMLLGGLAMLLIFPPMGVIFLAIMFFIVRSAFQAFNAIEQDLKTPQVTAIEGAVQLDLQRSTISNRPDGTMNLDSKPSISYSVQIGELKFSVSEHVFLVFKNGDPYAIYFTPHSKTILSVNWLRDDEDPFES